MEHDVAHNVVTCSKLYVSEISFKLISRLFRVSPNLFS